MTAVPEVPDEERGLVTDKARVVYRNAVLRQNGRHYLDVHLTTIDMAVEHAAPFIAAAAVRVSTEQLRAAAEVSGDQLDEHDLRKRYAAVRFLLGFPKVAAAVSPDTTKETSDE